jgi:hypothetical protein
LPEIPNRINLLLGAVGGLTSDNEPLICGGYIQRVYYNDCYIYKNGNWSGFTFSNLTTKREFGMYASYPSLTGNGNFLVAGGDSASGMSLTSIEYLTSSGWKQSTANLPSPDKLGCMVAINETHFLMISGTNSPSTYYFNLKTNTVTSGPPLLQARGLFSCASTKNSTTGSVTVVVNGGVLNGVIFNPITLNSTEILDVATGVWTKGPDLPVPLMDARMEEHPKGGVVVLGGRIWYDSANIVIQNSIYHLTSTKATQWTILPQRLNIARYQFVSFFVPDKIVSCK